jgi:hypothetical protein
MNKFIHFFQFLELIYQKKLLLGLAGLGLGFGFSIIVGQRPSSSWATNSINQSAIVATEISLPRLFEQLEVKKVDQLKPVCLLTQAQLLSGSLADLNKPIVIAGCSSQPVFNKLGELNLGDEIIIQGNNGGRYHFQVVEIRDTDVESLDTFKQLNTSGLLIFTPTNLLATRYLAILAKP